ncbi:hypothetical protein KDL44_06610 [bacterium]|nr:hypothetical protein [bacterium]
MKHLINTHVLSLLLCGLLHGSAPLRVAGLLKSGELQARGIVESDFLRPGSSIRGIDIRQWLIRC